MLQDSGPGRRGGDSPAKDLVLLLTHSGDYYTVDLVAAALARRGAPCLRIDSDLYPTQLRLNIQFDSQGYRGTLSLPDRDIDFASVRALWARRLWPGKLPGNLDPGFAAYCYRESRSGFFDSLALLENVRWVNPLAQGRAAESKPRQLALAVEEGLTIPMTVVGNDPAAVRDLYDCAGGEMVTKLLGALSQTMDASGDFLYTSRVSAAQMASIDELQFAPQIFQSLIPKKRELRAIFVGDQVFVGAIDTAAVANAPVDWRQLTEADKVTWREDELPEEVAAATRRLMKRLGLVYGAVDFIVDPDERHVFLEINQAGEWGWLQRDLDLPIAEALADSLLMESDP